MTRTSGGRWLSLAGLVLLLIPFPVLILQFGLTIGEFEILWGATGIAGSVACLVGIRWEEPHENRTQRRLRSASGSRLAVASVCLIAFGGLVLAGTIALVESCEPPCTGGGGVVNGTAASAATACGQQCGILSGGNLIVSPVQLLVSALGLDVLGVALMALAVGTAWRTSIRPPDDTEEP